MTDQERQIEMDNAIYEVFEFIKKLRLKTNLTTIDWLVVVAFITDNIKNIQFSESIVAEAEKIANKGNSND